MSATKLAVINEAAVKQLAAWDWIIEAVQSAFVGLAAYEAELFPLVLGRGSKAGHIVGAKSGLFASQGVLGLKLGSYWPSNREQGKPAHGSTTLLLDDADGLPKALINAHFLNGMRTAAANAVAARALAPQNAEILAIFGAGNQARFEVAALQQVRPVKQVFIVNRDSKRAAHFAEELQSRGLSAQVCDAQTALADAQLITTVTASREPLFRADWVAANAHISAMGSDAPGKQELPPALFARADLFADYREQSCRVGEFQYASDAEQARVIDIGAQIHAPKPRQHPMSLFDSSGIGLQDVAVAEALFQKAKAANLIQWLDF